MSRPDQPHPFEPSPQNEQWCRKCGKHQNNSIVHRAPRMPRDILPQRVRPLGLP